MFFTPKVESCYAALFDFLNVVESIFKVSSIPLPQYSPPDTMWDYSLPLLLCLASPSLGAYAYKPYVINQSKQALIWLQEDGSRLYLSHLKGNTARLYVIS